MANLRHLAILKQGVEVWNQWRKDNPEIKPDLKNANLKNLDLKLIDLSYTDLRGTNFNNAILISADFSKAKLGLNSIFFFSAFVVTICFEIYLYRSDFYFLFTVYLVALLLCLLRNFTAKRMSEKY